MKLNKMEVVKIKVKESCMAIHAGELIAGNILQAIETMGGVIVVFPSTYVWLAACDYVECQEENKEAPEKLSEAKNDSYGSLLGSIGAKPTEILIKF